MLLDPDSSCSQWDRRGRILSVTAWPVVKVLLMLCAVSRGIHVYTCSVVQQSIVWQLKFLLDKGRVVENLQKECLCYFIILSTLLWRKHFNSIVWQSVCLSKGLERAVNRTSYLIQYTIYAPGMELWASRWYICLFVCGTKTCNLCDNFWTIRDRKFMFGMHTQLMKPFQMISRSMTLWPWPLL